MSTMLLPAAVILLVLCIPVALADPSLPSLPAWDQFKRTHGKQYSSTEDPIRKRTWESNIALITRHNREADNGQHSFRLGVNKYSDMNSTEFRSIMNGYRPSLKLPAQRPTTKKATTKATTTKAPTTTTTTTTTPTTSINNATSSSSSPAALYTASSSTVDWRNNSYVTPIKDQGQCGSCWAFSAIGSLEGQTYKKTSTLVSLSEQNLVDCAYGSKYGNFGCNGGWMDSSFSYIKSNNGIDTTASYPYRASQGTCRFSAANVGATVTGYVDLPQGDETALQVAVATIGPIAVAIDASWNSFQLYSSGVYNEPSCSSYSLDHAVLVVGYGTLNSVDYWLVKNSWGTSWGDQGYIKMSRNANNQCGIAAAASYPTV